MFYWVFLGEFEEVSVATRTSAPVTSSMASGWKAYWDFFYFADAFYAVVQSSGKIEAAEVVCGASG